MPGGSGGSSPRGGDGSAGRRARGARAFAAGGPLDAALPSAKLVKALDQASGPKRRCDQASDDEVLGMLGRWEAAEAWCAAAKLGVIRALITRRALRGFEAKEPGGLPFAWQQGLIEEVSNQIGVSLRAADALIDLAWTLEARLVLTREALEAGVISLTKARIIAEATSVLDDERAAAAETLIAADLAGKTPGQIAAMIARAVVKVDPDGARKRRERAEQEDARVRFWREHAGTAALAGFGLPPDEALAANQHIQDKALEYKAAGVPGTMDQLRVRVFLDAINGTDSRPAPGSPSATGQDVSPDRTGQPRNAPGDDSPAGNGGTDPAGNGGTDPGGNGGPAGGSGSGAGLAANIMLTIPLVTLLGLAENPGEAHGFGPIDPALARQMAAAAAREARSTWCVTVTDQLGRAVGHGCAKPARNNSRPGRPSQNGSRDGPSFTSSGVRGPPDDGYGRWRLPIGGREFTVTLIPLPVTDCDHRYESAGYRPSALLRHLVEVRDGQCTQPTCGRAARRCDFEHATPWDQGGRTCCCNGGCRCRRDHKVKQSPGWKVTQPRPGYHQWTTPSGRTFTTEPMKYPI
jgi:hypothetical protein